MSNANRNAVNFRRLNEKFDKAGGTFTGSLGIKTSYPSITFNNTTLNENKYVLEFTNDNDFKINQLGVGARLNLKSDGVTDLLGSLNVTGNIIAYNDRIAIRSDAGNIHLNRIVPENDLIGVHCINIVQGGEGGLIRGQVQGGGWQQWRDRSAGVHIDAQDSMNAAHTLVKATHWGRMHLFAMDVHCPSDNVAIVKFHLGNGAEQFQFNAYGNAYAVGGWHVGSDRNFKEQIQPLNKQRTSWLDKVCALNASSFKYKFADGRRVGFIAQDVQSIIPEAVSVQTDTTDDVHNPEKDRLFIDPMAIIAAQNEAIKELRQRIETLEGR